MFEPDKYTTEQKLIKDFAGQLARQCDFLYFLENMKNETLPEKYWKAVGQGGYIGMLVPEEYEGADYQAFELGVFFWNMAQKGLVSFTLMNQFVACDLLLKFGDENQKKHIPDIVNAGLWAWAGTEHVEGMSLFDLSLNAENQGDSFKLTGKKSCVAGASEAEKIIVAARTGPLDETDGKKGVSLFIVDKDTPGVEMVPREINVRVTTDKEMMSITSDRFYDILFTDVSLPKENLLGEEGAGGASIEEAANLFMLMMSMTAIGWGEYVLEKAVDYARERVIFEEPIGSYQAIQHPLVMAKTELELAKLAVKRAVRAWDTGEPSEDKATYIGAAKYAAVEAAYSACDIAIQSHGGYAFDRETGIITLWPLILLMRIIPKNNDCLMERFAETALGLPGEK